MPVVQYPAFVTVQETNQHFIRQGANFDRIVVDASISNVGVILEFDHANVARHLATPSCATMPARMERG